MDMVVAYSAIACEVVLQVDGLASLDSDVMNWVEKRMLKDWWEILCILLNVFVLICWCD